MALLQVFKQKLSSPSQCHSQHFPTTVVKFPHILINGISSLKEGFSFFRYFEYFIHKLCEQISKSNPLPYTHNETTIN